MRTGRTIVGWDVTTVLSSVLAIRSNPSIVLSVVNGIGGAEREGGSRQGDRSVMLSSVVFLGAASTVADCLFDSGSISGAGGAGSGASLPFRVERVLDICKEAMDQVSSETTGSASMLTRAGKLVPSLARSVAFACTSSSQLLTVA